ncbi:ABC transporter substrate-binding protein [Frankia sp. QA3]|uniref:ABC transporter substrate-binding protein n=1 Tax=Frankia sp. QA3 TaxID=710111 RepID=UPI000269C069|nr:ABC transporter substrate-binding protein [Frankia sp. QA3]EIV92494.1 ABC-type branched-chain amino acid transport system, periplasmic component [Frankia sp. QA3]
MRRHLSLGTAAAVLALAAGASACSPGTTPSTTAVRCTTPGVTPQEIRLGLLYSDTGPSSASLAVTRAGIDARLGLANASGGINGRKVVYDWQDDSGTPAANALGARKLIEDKHDFGLLEYSLAAGASAQYLADRSVPVSGLAVGDAWPRYRNMFSFSYTTGDAVDTYGQFVKSRGGTRAALLRTALAAEVGNTGAKLVQSMQAVGIPTVAEVPYTSNVDIPAATAQKIISSGADTLLAVVDAGVALPPVLTALRAAGKNMKVIMSVSGYDNHLLREAGPAMAGVVVPVFYRPFEAGGPAIASYTAAMTRYAPQVQHPEQELALIAYINTDLFLKGLQLAGPCPTRKGFVDALRSVTSYDAGGLVQPPIDVKNGLGKQTTCWSFVQANDTGTAFTVVDENLCGRVLPAA